MTKRIGREYEDDGELIDTGLFKAIECRLCEQRCRVPLNCVQTLRMVRQRLLVNPNDPNLRPWVQLGTISGCSIRKSLLTSTDGATNTDIHGAKMLLAMAGRRY